MDTDLSGGNIMFKSMIEVGHVAQGQSACLSLVEAPGAIPSTKTNNNNNHFKIERKVFNNFWYEKRYFASQMFCKSLKKKIQLPTVYTCSQDVCIKFSL